MTWTDPFLRISTGITALSNSIFQLVILLAFRLAVMPDHILGRSMAAAEFVNAAALAFGALGGGHLLSTVGARPTGWIMAAMSVLAFGGTHLSLRRERPPRASVAM
ncbi:hypothetical protein ACFROC_00940 [Nocardia tengchongensis]|uniref:hypothetical protein n=1 Tax=Nocardia tengchongensis TaxID=2055889 RepID=UPI0036B0E943